MRTKQAIGKMIFNDFHPEKGGNRDQEEVLEADPEAPKSLEHTTVLYLQVAAGYNLLNRDSGIMGDVSDPYVVAQLGDMVQQTPAVSNQLNPVWKERNQFAFTVVHQELDRYLLLEA